MNAIENIQKIVGIENVLTGERLDQYEVDPSGKYKGSSLAVVRPENTEQVSEIVKIANEKKIPIVPQGGNTGLAGGCFVGEKKDTIILSLERMNKIKEIRGDGRIAIVEGGVILSTLHEAVAEYDLIFPLFFGARGSAMIGGNLATNAGGSNVLRYGNTRDLVLGLEAVMPTGEIVDLMSELHKDNSGYNLKHLLIGAEGTLGIITAAVLKLFPKPKAYATATISIPSLKDALPILNELNKVTNNCVEAFEYMPEEYFSALCERFDDMRQPFSTPAKHGVFLEIGAMAEEDAYPDATGNIPIELKVEELFSEWLEAGKILDAVICKSEAQRSEMWDRRERAYEVGLLKGVPVACDISVAVDKVDDFLTKVKKRVYTLNPNCETLTVSHLGDGNLHFSVWMNPKTKEMGSLSDREQITEMIEETVLELGGSFSAEHGIGLAKLSSMSRRKDPNAIAVMRIIKSALDPNHIMTPGKVIPNYSLLDLQVFEKNSRPASFSKLRPTDCPIINALSILSVAS